MRNQLYHSNMQSDSSLFLSAMVVLLGILFVGSTSKESTSPSDPLQEDTEIIEKNASVTTLPQVIKSVRLDKVYDLAGEPFPMENFDAMERLDRELLVNSYWHSSTLLNLKNAKRYFPIIEPILAAEGVPDDFKYVAVIESNLRNETSPAGAKGLWQFMTAVAKGFGLEVSGEVDERYHLEKSTLAACKLIKSYHKRFGSWTNAFGAYNMGETRFAREMANQKMDSYYDMNFGTETGRYLFRILAVKEIMQNPNEFGFYTEDQEGLYKPLNDCLVLTVDKSIPNLGTYALEHGTTYRILKIYNPWLLTGRLTVPAGKTYDIKIPRQ